MFAGPLMVNSLQAEMTRASSSSGRWLMLLKHFYKTLLIVQMKEGKGSGGNLFDDGADNNTENWTVYQMIRYET